MQAWVRTQSLIQNAEFSKGEQTSFSTQVSIKSKQIGLAESQSMKEQRHEKGNKQIKYTAEERKPEAGGSS